MPILFAINAYRLIRTAVVSFVKHDCSRMAAALSFFTAFSIAPLLILAMTIAGFFFDASQVQGQVEEDIQSLIGASGSEQVKEMLDNAAQPEIRGLVSLLGVLALLWGASAVVVQLQKSLNEVWGVRADPEASGLRRFFLKRLFSIAMVLVLGFVLVVSLVASAIANAFQRQLEEALPEGFGGWSPEMSNNAVSLLLLVMLFAAIFKVLPDAKVRWRDVTIGALLTAGLFVLGKYSVGLYLGSTNLGSSFGAAGSLALMLLWVYYSMMILLFGAEFTVAWACQRGRPVEPQKGAVLLPSREAAGRLE